MNYLLGLMIVSSTALMTLRISAKYKRSVEFTFLGIKLKSAADRPQEDEKGNLAP
ncbi:hypothetical protein [Amycolatopsis sp. WAC 01376]|uniref:hypothetical protein n=1 Tax=Amycolatopsis sp. WAC 01376 TaxID=2203195 RepID=UPI0013158054|nr:hypothetical protein [Amycolatopsis sp. WAC 01376]